ncbi:MAG TPA: murein biosynthesis integral membrane protein MurJ [Longimicrobiales bacterium]|nr:murein biosynthesis integral membrane protein MurJ [Longimicrobiales bacterium]
MAEAPEEKHGSGRSARWVAAGIFLSRIAGLVREMVFSRFFGTSVSADAWRAASKMPNVLQNLLGEGTLSASFIPEYSKLLQDGREEEAGRLAGVVFALLLAVAGALTLIGVLLAPALVTVFTPGFDGLQRELTIRLVRILFPMTGVLVLSAWSLGILNSHRSFFIPYVAPVLWNAVMIGALLVFGPGRGQPDLVIILGWAALAGGGLQFLIQLPWVFRLERSFRLSLNTRFASARRTIRNAGPATLGRGVVQVSTYFDLILASFLVEGAVAVLGYAQTLYVLPVSLFGMSVAAAELPELSRNRDQAKEVLQARIRAGLRRIAFLVIPAAMGYIVIGGWITAALYQRGDFGADDAAWTHFVLIGYSVGLVASTATRLFSSSFFALGDTRTPAIYAAVRVLLAAGLGAGLMLLGRNFEVAGHPLSPAGLALGSGIASWVEWSLLRRALGKRIGDVLPATGPLLRMVLAAAAAGAAGWGAGSLLPPLHPIPAGAVVLGAFVTVYFAVATALGVAEVKGVLGRVWRRFGGGKPAR